MSNPSQPQVVGKTGHTQRPRSGQNHQRTTILREIAKLDSLSTTDLQTKYQMLYGADPPKYKRSFLIKRIAYRIQELTYGGLDEDSKEALQNLLDSQGFDDRGLKTSSPRKPKKKARTTTTPRPVPGTRLTREYQGVIHEVIVGKDHFEYEGRPYKSLSVIARQITGTRWSGPVFFGLK